MKINTV